MTNPKPDDELVRELKKIALFLREISAQSCNLNRTQRDIAYVSAKWLEHELIGPQKES